MCIVPQKRCSRCKNCYHLDCFPNSKSTKDGKHTYCRKCCAEKKGRIWHPECLMPDGYRQCGHCQQCLTYDNFHKNPNNHLGLQNICKACKVIADAKYLDAHRDKNKERSKARYYAKPEELRRYKEVNAEHIAAVKRDWRKRNPDKVHKHKHDSNKRHPESRARRIKRYNERHPEVARLRGRVAAMKRRVKTDMTKRTDLLQMYEDQNERCAYCGVSIYWTIPHDIHVDHIKPVVRGGGNELDNLCLTCADCNYSKGDLLLEEWQLKRGW